MYAYQKTKIAQKPPDELENNITELQRFFKNS